MSDTPRFGGRTLDEIDALLNQTEARLGIHNALPEPDPPELWPQPILPDGWNESDD